MSDVSVYTYMYRAVYVGRGGGGPYELLLQFQNDEEFAAHCL